MIEADLFFKMLRFGLVGISGMGIDFGVTYVLKERLRVHKYIANGIGFILAATSNYLLNRYWTFLNKSPEILTQYIRFLLFSSIGLVLNSLIIFFLTDSRLRVNFYVAKGVAILVVFFWNFIMNYLFTF